MLAITLHSIKVFARGCPALQKASPSWFQLYALPAAVQCDQKSFSTFSRPFARIPFITSTLSYRLIFFWRLMQRLLWGPSYEFGICQATKSRPFCAGGNGISYDHEEEGVIVGGTNNAMATTVEGEAYLLIVRHGSVYTGFVSENASDWTLVGSNEVVTGMVPMKVD